MSSRGLVLEPLVHHHYRRAGSGGGGSLRDPPTLPTTQPDPTNTTSNLVQSLPPPTNPLTPGERPAARAVNGHVERISVSGKNFTNLSGNF
jgi:hypothetical protein